MKTKAKNKLEYLDTPEELKALGLRRIKRRHFTQKGEMTIKDCQVISEIRIDADLYDFLKAEAEKKGETSIDHALNGFLREAIERNKYVKNCLTIRNLSAV